MKNEIVAQAWANQTGRHRNGNSMSYSGSLAYSYGTVIARHAAGADGIPAVLVTTLSYSSTTAVHRGLLWEACGHLRRFEVPNVLAASEATHLANHKAIIGRASDAIQRSGRARTLGAWYLDLAQRAVDQANAYARAFGLSVPAVELDELRSDAPAPACV